MVSLTDSPVNTKEMEYVEHVNNNLLPFQTNNQICIDISIALI